MIKIYFFVFLQFSLLQSILLDKAFLSGRWLNINQDYIADWPGVQLNFHISNASYLQIQLGNIPKIVNEEISYVLSVWENGINYGDIKVVHTQNQQVIKIAEKLIRSSSYTFQIVKITEANLPHQAESVGTVGIWSLSDILTDGNLQVVEQKKQKFLFIGDSVTTGYEVDDKFTLDCVFETENLDHTHARFVSDYFQAEYQVIAWSGKGLVRNWGEYAQSSTITMRQLFDRTLANSELYYWEQNRFIPDLVFINFGTEDYSSYPYSYYWPEESEFIGKYIDFVLKISTQFPNAKFLLSCGPVMDFIDVPNRCENVKSVVQKLNEMLRAEKVKYVDLLGLMKTIDDVACHYFPSLNTQLKMTAILVEQVNSMQIQ